MSCGQRRHENDEHDKTMERLRQINLARIERERRVAVVESLTHYGHPAGWWTQECRRCKAEVALASHDQPSFYAHGTHLEEHDDSRS